MSTETQTRIASAFQAAGNNVQEGAEAALGAVKASFEDVKAFGVDVYGVVDNASRTAAGGMAAVNGSLVNYSKDVIEDTIDVSRKALGAKSLKDVVELQTAYAERRINAAFHTLATLNSLTQANMMAIWSPYASLLRTAGAKSDAVVKFERPAFKSVA